jgi:cyclic pyranopterin monophosphate synthase
VPEQSPSGLSHLDARGRASMVDVTNKASTERRAEVRCLVRAVPNTVAFLGVSSERAILEEARCAGLAGAKQTSELIPLCHPLPLEDLDVSFELARDSIEVFASAATVGQTGVEMEALTACALAAVSLVGAARGRDPEASIEALTLWEKAGGRSGHWRRDAEGVLAREDGGTSPPAPGR